MVLCISGEIRWWIFLSEALFFRLWLYSSVETLSHAVGNPSHQVKVKGILGGSILFPAHVSEGITVEKIEWDFRPQRRDLGYWLGEFRHGKLEHSGPTDRFGQRLDVVKGTTLRLKDLELDDGGIYNTRIWFTKAQFQEQRFNLTVYEPVPAPQIQHQVKSKTPGGCNVTLRCHTPGREELKVSWETGNPHRTLGKSVNQYQVSDNGRELHVFYWNSSFDSKFTCLVSNPVDQKRASFDLLSICQSDEGGHLRLSSPWFISFVIVLLVIMVTVMVNWMHWNIRLERHIIGVASVMREKWEQYFCAQEHRRGATQKMEMMRLNTEYHRPTLQVDSEKEEFSSCSTQPRKRFPPLTSYAVSDKKPSEFQHFIPQTCSLPPRIREEKDPLEISHCYQLRQSYSLPSFPKH